MKFSTQDLEQIKSLGISPETATNQLERFRDGFTEIKLCGNVKEDHGLKILSQEELKQYISAFESKSGTKQLLKFVPASGAASRMFKLLFNYLEGSTSDADTDIQDFFNRIQNFAFYDELTQVLEDDGNDRTNLVSMLLSESGLNYSSLPKALLTFHKYEDGSTTKAIDEHLIEGAQYCSDADGNILIHFTLSEEHIPLVKNHLDTVVPVFEKKFNKKYRITFSVQSQTTNTIAVEMDNEPFRTEDGKLLFRPGGHGALLKNLQVISADIIFIKNIDNVAANWLIQDTIDYKKALAGLLIENQEQVFSYCEKLNSGLALTSKDEREIVKLLETKLGYKVPESFVALNTKDKAAFLLDKLNRPIRVCGVVESKGTGGGPFWVRHADGSETLQLVETDQINKKDSDQLHYLNSSEYANITDLFCGIKNFKGEKFDLIQFRDTDTGFISQKSLNGKALKAMELPGLWNGAMSDWNTLFVQVPITTFNPVKTVLDLLKKEHQGLNS